MIIVKDDSVDISNLCPQLAMALAGTVEPVLDKLGANTIITSACEQTALHGHTSLHYSGFAVDVRIRDTHDGGPLFDSPLAVSIISKALKCDFDVVLEDDHVHIEYQPKRRRRA